MIVEMEAGDMLIHHANVIHRTGPNHTPRHRRNLGFVYHGAGATKDAEAARDGLESKAASLDAANPPGDPTRVSPVHGAAVKLIMGKGTLQAPGFSITNVEC